MALSQKFPIFSTVAALIGLVAGLGILGLAAQSSGTATETGAAETEAADPTSPPVFIMPSSGPFAPQTIAIPNARVIATWARSGHSDATAEAFRHWDKDGAIPEQCSVCHSGIGFRSFHGLDGSEKGLPTQPVPVGGVVDCDTCHNSNLGTITEITLPSSVIHPVGGAEVACLTCHQGRSAGITVAEAVGDKPEDAVDAELRFINPHYFVGGAMNLGSYGGMGFEYPGKSYFGRFLHARPVASCVSCHDPHSLEVSEPTCQTCHFTGKPEDIRISRVSYDGSGNTTKGIHADLADNASLLLKLMHDYAAEIAGTKLIHDSDRYPYFFADANGDGVVDQAEGSSVRYNAWTPRLVKAAFNWKAVTADPGAFAHNPPYALQLLYDSIESLSGPLGIDMGSLGLLR